MKFNKLKEYCKNLTKQLKFTDLILLIVITIVLIISIPLFIFTSSTSTTQKYEMPTLDLPIRYFSDSDVIGGSGVTESKNGWDSAIVDNGYQSFPTTKITLSENDYSSDIVDLPQIRSTKEIIKENIDICGEDCFDWIRDEQIKQYGDIAKRFLMGMYIEFLKEFDVDKDGKNEKIIGLCGTGGNHCPHEIIIVKDDKIIFSASVGIVGLGLTKSDTGNGFYLNWVPSSNKGDKWDTGLCCMPGYMKTRFIFENNDFKPIYEQEVLYFQVNNTDKVKSD